VAVGAGGDQPKRDPRTIGGHRAFAALLAPIDRGAASDPTATGGLGDAPIDRHIGQLQADELVVGSQRQGVHALGDAAGGPLCQPPPDGPV
jgi:hypothetical protein